MAVSDAEIEAVRVHLGYGAVITASAYTPDGFYELFHQVVQPSLYEGASTSVALAIAAGNATCTPAAMTGIALHTRLVVDTGNEYEVVAVRGVTGSTFTATFSKAHAANCPIQVESGVSRLRTLLWSADKAWQTLQSAGITQTAGIKQLGQGEIEWFPGAAGPLKATLDHYKTIVAQLAALVQVQPAWESGGSGKGISQLEAY